MDKNTFELKALLGKRVIFIGERDDGLNKGLFGVLQEIVHPKVNFIIKVLNNPHLDWIGVLNISEIEILDYEDMPN